MILAQTTRPKFSGSRAFENIRSWSAGTHIKHIDGKSGRLKSINTGCFISCMKISIYSGQGIYEKDAKNPEKRLNWRKKVRWLYFPGGRSLIWKYVKSGRLPDIWWSYHRKIKRYQFKKAWSELDAEFATERALIELRMRGNETQKKLADKLNTKQAYISKVESGAFPRPSVYIAKMADALNADAKSFSVRAGLKKWSKQCW